jgi:hypothetical protein
MLSPNENGVSLAPRRPRQAGGMAPAQNNIPTSNPCASTPETAPADCDDTEPASEDDEEALCAEFDVEGGNAAELLEYDEDGLDGLDDDDNEQSDDDNGVLSLALKSSAF